MFQIMNVNVSDSIFLEVSFVSMFDLLTRSPGTNDSQNCSISHVIMGVC